MKYLLYVHELQGFHFLTKKIHFSNYRRCFELLHSFYKQLLMNLHLATNWSIYTIFLCTNISIFINLYTDQFSLFVGEPNLFSLKVPTGHSIFRDKSIEWIGRSAFDVFSIFRNCSNWTYFEIFEIHIPQFYVTREFTSSNNHVFRYNLKCLSEFNLV